MESFQIRLGAIVKGTILLLGACSLLFAAACTPRPQIVKRYKTVDYVDVSQYPLPENPRVSFVSIPIEEQPKGKTVFDLSDRGQSALLKSLGDKIKEPKDFMAAVGNKIGEKGGGTKDIDLTEFKKRIVFTVERGSRRPADRLDWLKIAFDIRSPNVRFVRWSQAATVYEKINLGSLSFTQEQAAKLRGGLALKPSDLTELGLDLESKRSLTESRDERQRIVDLNIAVVGDKSATVVRQGALDRDLDGNTIVDFELKYTGPVDKSFLHMFQNLWDKGNTPKAADEIYLAIYDSQYPRVAQDILSYASMDFNLRTVKSGHGDDTINEGDDEVLVVTGKTTPASQAILIPERDQKLEVHNLGLPNAAQDSLSLILTYEPNDSTACQEPDDRVLKLKEYAEAQNFYDWLEKSFRSGKFGDRVVVTQNKYVLCLVDKPNKHTVKRVLRPSEIPELWIFNDSLNWHSTDS